MNKTVTHQCSWCQRIFQLSLKDSKRKIKRGYHIYCSRNCGYLGRTRKQQIVCLCCNQKALKLPKDIRKSSNHFCSRSCAATYNNRHKKYGTNRSKLEIYLESMIRQEFPNSNLLCNDRQILDGLELDFYFPDLRFAIELNGIVHYEPIYGPNQFKKVQNRDKQKIIRCYEQGIELVVVDISSCKYLSNKAKQKYWTIFKELVQIASKRII